MDGRSALLVYILHTAFILFIFSRTGPLPLFQFLGLLLLHAAARPDKPLPFMARFLLGG